MPISSACVTSDERSCLVNVLVTGADGFVGRHLVARLVEQGHTVAAACRPLEDSGSTSEYGWGDLVRVVPLELTDQELVAAAVAAGEEAVIHLAAVASAGEARDDPARAWMVNAAGTARLLEAVISSRSGARDPGVLG